jgi:Ca2+-transporting ATPase
LLALRTESSETPLQVKLDGLAERIAKLGAAAALLMFLILSLKYIITVVSLGGQGFGPDCAAQECAAEAVQRFIGILISAITVIVVAVPEGLPLAVTLSLAYGTMKMLKDNNLVRVLAACETMGGWVFARRVICFAIWLILSFNQRDYHLLGQDWNVDSKPDDGGQGCLGAKCECRRR